MCLHQTTVKKTKWFLPFWWFLHEKSIINPQIHRTMEKIWKKGKTFLSAASCVCHSKSIMINENLLDFAGQKWKKRAKWRVTFNMGEWGRGCLFYELHMYILLPLMARSFMWISSCSQTATQRKSFFCPNDL